MQYTGHCIYCGQNKILAAGEGLSEEEINRLATMECNCIDAQVVQRIDQRKNYAEANIKKLFDSDISIKDLALNSIELLASQRIKKISITSAEGVKATLTARENSIKCERFIINKQTLED